MFLSLPQPPGMWGPRAEVTVCYWGGRSRLGAEGVTWLGREGPPGIIPVPVHLPEVWEGRWPR